MRPLLYILLFDIALLCWTLDVFAQTGVVGVVAYPSMPPMPGETPIIPQADLDALNVFPTTDSAIGYALAASNDPEIGIGTAIIVDVAMLDTNSYYTIEWCDDLASNVWSRTRYYDMRPDLPSTNLFMFWPGDHGFYRVVAERREIKRSVIVGENTGGKL